MISVAWLRRMILSLQHTRHTLSTPLQKKETLPEWPSLQEHASAQHDRGARPSKDRAWPAAKGRPCTQFCSRTQCSHSGPQGLDVGKKPRHASCEASRCCSTNARGVTVGIYVALNSSVLLSSHSGVAARCSTPTGAGVGVGTPAARTVVLPFLYPRLGFQGVLQLLPGVHTWPKEVLCHRTPLSLHPTENHVTNSTAFAPCLGFHACFKRM